MRLMHALMLCSIAMFGAAPSLTASASQTPPGAPPAPAAPVASPLKFSPEVIELGEMTAGQPKSASLTIANGGNSPVTIESVKGGCGCTTVSEWPKAPLAAGASFTVQVTVDPGSKTGVDLVKPLHVVVTGAAPQTIQIKGHVKVAVRVAPETLEAGEAQAASSNVSLQSVDGAAFRVTGVTPAGVIDLRGAVAASSRFEFPVNLQAWEKAGRPASIVIATDRADAKQLVVPVRSAEAVTMFRLPAAAVDDAARASIEASQDALIRSLDDQLAKEERSPQFRMRLHRETGMLFVHGSEADLGLVREAMKTTPELRAIRESRPTPAS